MSETPRYTPKDSEPRPFHVFFPGIGTEGRSLTGLRHTLGITYKDAAYVPSSAAAPFELKKDEKIGERYKIRAAHVAARAGQNDVIVIGHSAGSWEAIDFADALLDTSWAGQAVHLELTAPMGYHRGKTALVNLIEVKRRADTILEYARKGQHVAYPLADDYYKAVSPEPHPEGMNVIFEDSAAKRAERRELFFEMLEKIAPETERQSLFQRLLKLDESISRAALAKNREETEKLLGEREKILFPYMEKLQHGEHHPEDLHENYLTEYNELPGSAADPRRQQLHIGYFLLRNYLGRLPQGMTKPLAAVIEKATKKGKNVTFSFVMLEQDDVSPLSSVPGLRKQVAARGIKQAFQGVKLIETHSHPTIAVWTDATVAIFESTKKK